MNTFRESALSCAFFLILLSGCKHDRLKRGATPQLLSHTEQAVKPRLIVFSSLGGGGQTSASLAVQAYLEKDYDVEIIQTFADVLKDFDPIRICSVEYMNCEDLYNFFLRHGFGWSGGMWSFIGTHVMNFWQERLSAEMINFLMLRKPDIIISVTPFINGAICRAAEHLQIPFGVVTVDLDVRGYLNGLEGAKYDLLTIGIPFDDQMIWDTVKSYDIPLDQVRVIGFPVRKQFFDTFDAHKVRASYGFPQDKPIVMVMMGSAGSSVLLSFARKLSRLKQPMHLIFCIGRNEGLRQYLEKMTFPEHITMSIFGFTQRIADFMKISDILITKSGSVSVCEALYARIPMLVDHTATVLTWERVNIDFITEHGFGEAIHSLHRLPWHINHMLENRNVWCGMKNALEKFEAPDFEMHLQDMARDMLADGMLVHATTYIKQGMPLERQAEQDSFDCVMTTTE